MLDHMSAALEEEALTGAESQARRIEALRLEALAVSPAVVAGGRPAARWLRGLEARNTDAGRHGHEKDSALRPSR